MHLYFPCRTRRQLGRLAVEGLSLEAGKDA